MRTAWGILLAAVGSICLIVGTCGTLIISDGVLISLAIGVGIFGIGAVVGAVLLLRKR